MSRDQSKTLNYLERLRELDRKEEAAKYEGLASMILEFVKNKDGDMFDSWSGTQRDYASVIMTDFCKFIGLEIAIPYNKPVMTKLMIDKHKLYEEISNEINGMIRDRINECLPIGNPL